MQHIENHAHHSNGKSISDAATVPAAVSSGQVLGSNESTYVGATHWAAILDDVSLLQTASNVVNKL
jgi:hypothetical protein